MSSEYVSTSDEELTIKVEQAKKDTVIDTVDGEALVTKGNYIATYVSKFRKGKQFGITEADLNNNYTQAK